MLYIIFLSRPQRKKTRGHLVPTVDGTYKLRLTISKKKINKQSKRREQYKKNKQQKLKQKTKPKKEKRNRGKLLL